MTGQLHQIACDFYQIQLTVEALSSGGPQESEEGYEFRFRLNFDNRDYMAGRHGGAISLELERMSICPSPSGRRDSCKGQDAGLGALSSSILLQLFPFTLIFRPDLRIIATGLQLKQMFASGSLNGQELPDVARMRRPKLRLTWDNVRSSFNDPDGL